MEIKNLKREVLFGLKRVYIDKDEIRGEYSVPLASVRAFEDSLIDLGYKLDENLVEKLQYLNPIEFVNVMSKTLTDALRAKGAHVEYNLLWEDYEERLGKSSLVLNLLDIVDYISGGTFSIKEKITPATDEDNDGVDFIYLKAGSDATFTNYVESMLKSRTPFSHADKSFLRNNIVELSKLVDFFEVDYQMNENLIFVITLLINKGVVPVFDTTSNAVRFIKHYYAENEERPSGSLRRLNNADRRMILSIFENLPKNDNTILGAKRHIKFLQSLNRVLHANSKINRARFPYAAEIFDILSTDAIKEYKTVEARVEEMIQNKDISVLEFLENFPGILLRKASKLFLTFGEETLLHLYKVSSDIDLEQILSLRKFFENINNKTRLYQYDGLVYEMTNELEYSESDVMLWLLLLDNIIVEKLRNEKNEARRILLDSSFDEINLPNNNRESENLHQLPDGSKVAYTPSESNKITLFMHWKDDCDLDLSASLIDEDLNPINRNNSVWYGGLRQSWGIHSGDVRSARQGDAEMITVYVDEALKLGARYVVLNANIYAHYVSSFNELNESFAGIMLPNEGGEKFDPKRVIFKGDVLGDTSYVVPAMYDLVENKLIWLNIQQKGALQHVLYQNVKTSEDSINMYIRAKLMKLTTAGELVKYYARANNVEIVDLNSIDLDTFEAKDTDVMVATSLNEVSSKLSGINSYNETQVVSLLEELRDGGFKVEEEVVETQELEKEAKLNLVEEVEVSIIDILNHLGLS